MAEDDAGFQQIAERVRAHAAARPQAPALRGDVDSETLSYAQLDALMDRIAAALQREGLRPGDAVALAGAATPRQAALFLGALRAGLAVAPLATSVTPVVFAGMLGDAQARWLFVDDGAAALAPPGLRTVHIERELEAWLAPPGHRPAPVALAPEAPFNIIYSSGTTGLPKGIVQSHGMRWAHVQRGARYGYGPDSRTLLATPLYSNTTLVVFMPSIAYGGCVSLMARFEAGAYLARAVAERISHTMLVPVQYQRLMDHSDFGRHDLSAFRLKFCTSAPFSAALKGQVLRRWPGGLIEFYGMTEGGGTCILEAHEHPDKLHTVGRPQPGHDIRLIDAEGRELPAGEAGEVVGHSPAMMNGYHGRPELTREAEWYAPDGKRFIRTGDIGRFDAEGFLTLIDRKKDMIISGGFNIYPSDLEAALRDHPAVAEAAVIGVPSAWGESPVAYVVARTGAPTAAQLRDWLNARVGKTQRLLELRYLDELPRSAIGKVLKRELRERHEQETQQENAR
ncbi:acyl--CoA ligase [Roseateles sp. DAIF2]|uniref:class I adenylate-forming enzyme family protein n=1 Tax=Roseateles sp. DAIF2 TaxID=2714952 RepID=UPI0018A2D4E7|nr:class I adenylate-forming enzyme family protein [Roseateles sp. DAIF2]QPF75165.1 acyl--CoA ligase [Roseateles sp. DAIF2]